MPKRKPVETPSEPPLGDDRALNKPPSKQGLGSNSYTDRALAEPFAQPIDKKHSLVRNTWAETAMVLALRAKKASQTYGKKDFNALYRLILSAGIAHDKAFPTTIQPLGGNLILNLFGSLGENVARKILEPVYPKVEIVEVVSNDETTTEKSLEGEP